MALAMSYSFGSLRSNSCKMSKQAKKRHLLALHRIRHGERLDQEEALGGRAAPELMVRAGFQEDGGFDPLRHEVCCVSRERWDSFRDGNHVAVLDGEMKYRAIDLSGNHIKELPSVSALSVLASLKTLKLDRNGLKSISSSISALKVSPLENYFQEKRICRFFR